MARSVHNDASLHSYHSAATHFHPVPVSNTDACVEHAVQVLTPAHRPPPAWLLIRTHPHGVTDGDPGLSEDARRGVLEYGAGDLGRRRVDAR